MEAASAAAAADEEEEEVKIKGQKDILAIKEICNLNKKGKSK